MGSKAAVSPAGDLACDQPAYASVIRRALTYRPVADIAGLVGLALACRLGFLLAIRRVVDMPDAVHYVYMARQFAEGDFVHFDENLPVLFPALAAIGIRLMGNWEWAFWTVSLIASSLLVVPVYLLARTLFDRSAARIAGLLVCFWPWLIDYGSRIAPEALAVTLWFGAVWWLYLAMERGGRYTLLAPLAFFALHLARPEGTFLMLASPVGAALLAYRRGSRAYRRVAYVTLLTFALLTGFALVMRTAIGTATITYRAPLSSDLVDYFRRGGIDLFKTFLQLSFDVLPIMVGPLLLIFLGVGLFRPCDTARKFRLESVILFFCAVQLGLAVANLSPSPRYLMPVVVALSLWSARGIHVVGAQAAAAFRKRWLRALPAAVVIGTMMIGSLANVANEHVDGAPGLPREYKLAGRWMKAHLEPGLILSRKPQVGLYADMPTTGPATDDDVASAIARAVSLGARYLVYDERYSASLVPGLQPLLDPSRAPKELRLMHADLSPWPGARIVVYEVVAPGIEYLTEEEFPAPSSRRGPDARRRTKFYD